MQIGLWLNLRLLKRPPQGGITHRAPVPRLDLQVECAFDYEATPQSRGKQVDNVYASS